ncbi:MAG: hypothetical protein ACE5E3_05410, partial [Mariprofundus sp.]
EPEALPIDDPADSSISKKILLSESDLSDEHDIEEPEEWKPMVDPGADNAMDGADPFADEMSGDSAFETEPPVHADVSGSDDIKRKGSGMLFASITAIALLAIGGFYWLVMGPQEQAEQVAGGQQDQQHLAQMTDEQLESVDVAAMSTAQKKQAMQELQAEIASLKKKDAAPSPTETADTKQADLEKANAQRAAAEKAKAEQLLAQKAAAEKAAAEKAAAEKAAVQRAAAEKAEAQRLVAEKAAAQRAAAKKAEAQRVAAEKAAAQRAAAEKAKAQQLAREKAAANKVAAIKPATPLQKQPAKAVQTAAPVVDEPGNWVIYLASVNSNKSAIQHVARFRAMGVKSEAVRIKDKGRIFHRIRMSGFSSKLAAQKQSAAMAKKLGLRGARIEKL